MFLILRRGAYLTITETKIQYDDARASGYTPFLQTEDATYARAFLHAWYGLSSLIGDGYIDPGKLPADTRRSELFLHTQNKLSGASTLPELRNFYRDPRELLLEDATYIDSAYVFVHPSDLSCELTYCYDQSCLLETQGYEFMRVDTLDYGYGFRGGFKKTISDLYALLVNEGCHAIEAELKTTAFQEASLPVSSERYVDQATLRSLYPPVHAPNLRVVSSDKEKQNIVDTPTPETNRSELGYADGNRAARVLCRDLYSRLTMPMFLAALCRAVEQ